MNRRLKDRQQLNVMPYEPQQEIIQVEPTDFPMTETPQSNPQPFFPSSWIWIAILALALVGMVGPDLAYLTAVAIYCGIACLIFVVLDMARLDRIVCFLGTGLVMAIFYASNLDNMLMFNVMLFAAVLQRVSWVAIVVIAALVIGNLFRRN
jgi:hypothetical protein